MRDGDALAPAGDMLQIIVRHDDNPQHNSRLPGNTWCVFAPMVDAMLTS